MLIYLLNNLVRPSTRRQNDNLASKLGNALDGQDDHVAVRTFS